MRIFENLRDNDREKMRREVVDAYSLEKLRGYMDERKIVRVNWCGDPECAYNIKDQVAGEIRGTLWERQEEPEGLCIMCPEETKYIAYVSRTY